jgi:NAD(P)-dependent dehydrogenase (short-subunit alcohol dehydrogenase family)
MILSSDGKLNMQIFDLKGKTAIITGASSGLGERCARSLSGAARVILAAELGHAKAIEMDVSDK